VSHSIGQSTATQLVNALFIFKQSNLWGGIPMITRLRFWYFAIAALILSAPVFAVPALAAGEEEPQPTKILAIPMSDGVTLQAALYLPAQPGQYPTLFAASPYRFDNNGLPAYPAFLWRETGPIGWYLKQGYAFVHLDTRGTGRSEGDYRFLDKREQRDLAEVIEWIAKQPWSTGKVGGIGQSYYAMVQWFMGIQNPPHLATRIRP
jgi:predicted acyl esterase